MMKRGMALGMLTAFVLCMLMGCETPHKDAVESVTTTTSTTTITGDESMRTTTDSTTAKTTQQDTTVKTSATTVSAVRPTVQESEITESSLSNALKLLQTERKLTLGFIGGSITEGASSQKGDNGDGSFSASGGDLSLSWVNRTAAWFRSQFPNAVIETVNAGVSDTATNFGLFRLESTLMNKNGHDMPDVVFVEYNTNDWVYDTQSKADLALQAESLFRNIYAHNPYAEIVVVCTARAEDSESRLAYQQVASHYGIPMIDVGIPLTNAIRERIGTTNEIDGGYYYTTDNLHPSCNGFGIYFNEIQAMLAASMQKITLSSHNLYNYYKHLPKPLHAQPISSPRILTGDQLSVSGNAQVTSVPITVNMYHTGLQRQAVTITPTSVMVNGVARFSFVFTGTTLGILLQMSNAPVEMVYTIDGKSRMFRIDDTHLGFQMYDHAQVFMLAHGLDNAEHDVKIVFRNTENVRVGGMLVG